MSSTDTQANVIQKGSSPLVRSRPLRLLDASARSVAIAWIAAYLGATAVLLLIAREYAVAAVHLVVIAIAIWTLPSRTRVQTFVGDLLPLFAAMLAYAEVPRVIAAIHGGTVTYHDAIAQTWDLGLFRTQPALTLAPRMASGLLSEVLHAGYLLYYASIFIPPLILFLRNERRGLGQTVAAITITATVCWTIFAFFPIEGPRYAWGVSPLVPDGFLRRFTLGVLAAGSSRGTAFPSSHVAVAVAQTVLAFRWQPRVARVLVVVSMAIGVGAVYGGFHYAIDTIAGAALGAAIGSAVLILSSSGAPHRFDRSKA